MSNAPIVPLAVLPLRGGRRVAAVHAAEPIIQLRGQGVRLLRRRRQQLPGKTTLTDYLLRSLKIISNSVK